MSDTDDWLMWTWLPGKLFGWMMVSDNKYSSRERVEARAEEWRSFLRSCGLPVHVEVRAREDGSPDYTPEA